MVRKRREEGQSESNQRRDSLESDLPTMWDSYEACPATVRQLGAVLGEMLNGYSHFHTLYRPQGSPAMK